jgi:hypothetical protein
MAFVISPEHGHFTANHIKFLRLSFAAHPATVLAQVQGSGALIEASAPLVNTMLTTFLRV